MNIKETILTAGVTLLKDKGIAALTQPQVAKAAGIKQSHLTYYFPTRTDLLLGIAEYSISAMLATMASRLAGTTDAASLMAPLTEALLSGIPPRLILGLIVAADAEPDIRPHLREFIKHVRGQIQEFLAHVDLAGRPDAALLFHATIVGLAVMHQARMDAESTGEVKNGIAALLRLLESNATPIERRNA